MKFITALLLSLVACSAGAQVASKFYYNKHWELTTQDSAIYIRTGSYDTTTGVFNGPIIDSYSNGKQQMTGSVFGNIREGDFSFYFANGQIESTGKFLDNKRSGRWTYYHPNGQERLVVEFAPKNLRLIVSHKDSTGASLATNGTGTYSETYELYRVPHKVVVTGSFKNHQKDGTWECHLSNGTKLYCDQYKNGKFVKGTIYPDGNKGIKRINEEPHNILELPYKFLITTQFVAANGIDFDNYPILRLIQVNGRFNDNPRYGPIRSPRDIDHEFTKADLAKAAKPGNNQTFGDDEIFTIVEETAQPIGGMNAMYARIAKAIIVPDDVRPYTIQAKTYFEFIVDKDGTLLETRQIRSTGFASLDKEARRIYETVIATPKWQPAMHRSKPVKQRMLATVHFNFAGVR